MQGRPGISRPMMRRIAVVSALLAASVLGAATWAAVRLHMQDQEERVVGRLLGSNYSFSRGLLARLSAGRALVQALSAGDIGPDDQMLRQKVLHLDAIRSVVVAPWKGSGDNPAPSAMPVPDDADLVNLRAGQTLLKAAASAGERPSVYLIHIVSRGAVPAIAQFELAPQWLWQDAQDPRDSTSFAVSVAIVDLREHIIYGEPPLSADVGRLIAHVPIDARESQRAALARSWQAEGRAWRGAISRFDFGAARISAQPWNIVTYVPAAVLTPAFAAISGSILPLLAFAAMMAALATFYLSRMWEPALVNVQRALDLLETGEFSSVALGAAADTPRRLAESFNRTMITLHERMQSQRILGEIDRLLLESAEIEQALDGVLSRLCAMTGCHAAAVALIDRDAAGYGRSFVAIGDGTELPVSRISIDTQVLETLADSPQGLTVTHCEPERHGFLEPLRDLGAEFFWIWPVTVQGRVAAILSIGYTREPGVRPEITKYGSECGTRLATALWNSVRDEQLYRQAHFDSLTALPNRLLFHDRLSQELASSAGGSQRGALLYVDLDHFKKVNDSDGHLAGDQLLTIVAQRLRASVKDGDTVARLGGDEFTVILRNVGAPEAAQEIAARIIDSLQRPVSIAGRDHFVQASIGVTLFPDDGDTIEGLMRNADLAMYRAKDGGRARAVFYDRKMAQTQLPIVETGLYRALRRREFLLYYQPQYALRDGSMVGLEALLRWQTPRDGTRLPRDFVPAAEESGLIVDIGAWALETACNQLASWRAQGIAPARLALNLSVQQLRTQDFSRLVRRTLQSAGLPAEMLEFEITEAAFAEEAARANLKQLAALGVRLALDDFGTGYSSLNYLRQHPLQSIKIDSSFMLEVPDSIQAATLAQSIINMAHALGKTVVAEGVETIEQLDFLRDRGCDAAQGFVLSKPVTTAVVSELLEGRGLADTGLLKRAAG